ncbi:MAG: pSer/pThr/pTyr-binding forkhead associated (FHA) protein [Planctomycetota bacterium]
MYVLLERPGHPPRRIKVEGGQAVIGRAPSCDVVIDEEFVSKQHLRVLSGLVAVDVSSNGTFVDGQRIQGGVVAAGRSLQIADSDITLRLEPDEVEVAKATAPPVGASASDSAVAAKQVSMLHAELQSAAKRLKSKSEACSKLEAELKSSASSAAQAAQETATLRQEAAALHKQIAVLEQQVVEIEQQVVEIEQQAAEPKPPTDGSAAGLLLFNVQRENAKLKMAMAKQKAAVAADAVKLAAAQSDLAKQLAAANELGRAAGHSDPDTTTPAASGSSGSSFAAAPFAAPASEQGTGPNSGTAPPAKPGKAALPFGDSEPPTKAPASSPAAGMAGSPLPAARGAGSPVAAGPSAGDNLNTNRLLELLQKDADAMAVRQGDPLDAFLLVEGFRFLRRMERVITRLAGGLIQLYQNQTMVPGIGGNLRQLLAEAAAHPDKPHVRQELLNYLKELGRWLVVALSAYRKAAAGIATQIKAELTAEALTASDPISIVKRATGKSDSELWRRVCEHMKTLTTDEITERVEKLARDAADELTEGELSDSEEANSFG